MAQSGPALQNGVGRSLQLLSLRRRDARLPLIGQPQAQLVLPQQPVFFGPWIARQDQPASIGGRDPGIDQLDRCPLVQHSGRRQSLLVALKAALQGHLQAVGQERDQDVRLRAVLKPALDRLHFPFTFQGAKHRLDLRQLDRALPQGRRGLAHQVGAQQAMTVASFRQAQLPLLDEEPEGVPCDRLMFLWQFNGHIAERADTAIRARSA